MSRRRGQGTYLGKGCDVAAGLDVVDDHTSVGAASDGTRALRDLRARDFINEKSIG